MGTIPFKFKSDKVPDLLDLITQTPDALFEKVACKKVAATIEEEDFLEKVSKAAENANTPVLMGISAIGELLAHVTDEVRIEAINDIGWLIHSLGVQANAVCKLKEDAEVLLAESRKIKIASENGGLMS
ncbi:hypothetical protein OIV75_002527 [Acinetobacter baumannii]|nr:hypothetical protein [Acinetobacter baumannii]EKV9552559.1 hypothetical protein [Acinetobacter baumannii]EKW6572865.1 hypothetical protein [Acinetobacter baumannii]EKW6582107.1 hypothetical protein [Acinetobacter baumannii]EKW8757910.1 hypothetical protein [Acinetobacter baumannii]